MKVREEWMDDALCAQVDPELFFPEASVVPVQAKRICAACDVREQCLKFAIDNGIEHGVWGGTSPEMRRKARGPWRGSVDRQRELAGRGMPVREIARLCEVSERTVHRTLAG